MGFYRSTFMVAIFLIAVAVVCAFLPEIRERLHRLRRRRSERHVITLGRDSDVAPRRLRRKPPPAGQPDSDGAPEES